MKIGIELRIDVTKIDKARIYEGQKGKYLTMTAFVDLDNQDQYGNNGMITHKKEEGEQGQTPILGNTKVFWTDNPQQQSAPQVQPGTQQQASQYANQTGQPMQGSPQQPPAGHNQGVQQQQSQMPDSEFDEHIPF